MASESEKVSLHVYMDRRLRDVIDAARGSMTLSACALQRLAEAFGRPDLSKAPQKPLGRPAKKKG